MTSQVANKDNPVRIWEERGEWYSAWYIEIFLNSYELEVVIKARLSGAPSAEKAWTALQDSRPSKQAWEALIAQRRDARVSLAEGRVVLMFEGYSAFWILQEGSAAGGPFQSKIRVRNSEEFLRYLSRGLQLAREAGYVDGH
jgi:hypothetical protein